MNATTPSIAPQATLLDAPQPDEEVPSVFSVVNRYMVGRAEVSQPAEDGSRVMRLMAANGATVVEASLAPQLCAFVAERLTPEEVSEDGDAENQS